MATDHVCTIAAPTCHCSILADEPSPRCPVHGGAPLDRRCAICGQFLPRDPASDDDDVGFVAIVTVNAGLVDDLIGERLRAAYVSAFTHPPTDRCVVAECELCALRDCPAHEPLHYHHDGCPICAVQG
jgi:hypothetical protein